MRDAFPPPMCCVVVFIHLRMETPLCGRSGGHTGTAPTVSFGWIGCGRVGFVWVGDVVGGIARECITEMGRGGACVPARVALQGRIHRSSPAHNACIGWYGNAATRTFGRARRRRPYGFVWVDCVQMVILFVWDCVEKYYGAW